MKVRKRPVTVEARQFDGTNAADIVAWIEAEGGKAKVSVRQADESSDDTVTIILIKTLEGTMVAGSGWWVIQGVHGEFYPCQDDVFEHSYDRVESEVAPDGSTVLGVVSDISPETDDELAHLATDPIDFSSVADADGNVR